MDELWMNLLLKPLVIFEIQFFRPKMMRLGIFQGGRDYPAILFSMWVVMNPLTGDFHAHYRVGCWTRSSLMGNPPATKGPAWFQDVSTAFSAWEIPYIYIYIYTWKWGILRAWNPIIHTFSGKLGMVYYQVYHIQRFASVNSRLMKIHQNLG